MLSQEAEIGKGGTEELLRVPAMSANIPRFTLLCFPWQATCLVLIQPSLFAGYTPWVTQVFTRSSYHSPLTPTIVIYHFYIHNRISI